MSVSNKSAVSALKAIESWIRCPEHALLWGTSPLSERNTVFVCDLYTLMACFWYDSSHRPELLNQRWVRSLLIEPVDKVVDFLKDLDYELCSGSLTSMSTFNQWRKVYYPTFGQIISPLSENLQAFFNQGCGLGKIRTCLRFITRANFPDPLGLEEQAFSNWLDICLAQPSGVDVEDQSRIMRTIFPRTRWWLREDDFRPRFGPGASYDRQARSIEEKYLLFKSDPLLDYTGQKYSFPTSDLPRLNTGEIRTHRVHFVPKQLDKMRVVSMEPHSLMFYQLGGFDLMCRYFRHSHWSKHIDLERADLNQDLAWEGSISGEFATIDLSSASDSVRYELVRQLFKDTCLRELLIGTRSRYAEYEGTIYTPTYFAPMGSGLCFPVECAVFASIVESVMNHNGDRRAWRVYGDDIILPCDRAEELIAVLTQLGFTVNKEKSFYDGNSGFRESCGGDYYKGEDVRPIYVSRFWTGLTCSSRHPSTIEGQIDLANRLVNYPLTRQRVIQSLLRVKPGVLFDDTGEVGLWSKDPSNFHLKSRYNPDIMSWEYLSGGVRSRTSRCDYGQGSEDILLYEYLRSHEHVNSCEFASSTSIGHPSPAQWKRAWRSPAPGWDRGLQSPRP